MTAGIPSGRLRRRSLTRRSLLTGALGGASALTLSACTNGDGRPGGVSDATTTSSTTSAPDAQADSTSATPSDTGSATTSAPSASPRDIAERAVVPVLCWHQLRDWRASDSEYDRSLLVCPPANFRAQLDALADDGWTTIGPDQYLKHLVEGAPLPTKPVMLSFDDSHGSQISVGLPELLKRDMTATFFVMTVVLGNKGWMRRSDVRDLAAEDMTVGSHTWDHHRVDEYSGSDFRIQLEEPRATLEDIIGQPVEHFAYPFGAWDEEALPHVADAGYRTAYQLNDRKPSKDHPLLTLRRDLVDSRWSGKDLLAQVAKRV